MAKSRIAIGIMALVAASGAMAETTLSHIVVNQQWPWCEKVDVDFVLSGETSDVEVRATWDAHPEPYRLGTLFSAAPGQNRFTWDPSASPFAGQTLTGFTVSFSIAALSAHTYLVVDLVNGGYEYLADVPAGGWTSAHKTSKMVFRRIPAGTYTLGEPSETFTFLKTTDYSGIWNRRTVTFTSDFYVGIFKYTQAQHDCLDTGNPGTSCKPKKVSYYSLRGVTNALNAELNVDWPATGYKVAADSVVAKLRAKVGSGLVVDLCEEEQWEVAAHAGTTSILPNGVTTADDLTLFTNKLNEISAWYGTIGSSDSDVGQFATNAWGLCDVVGLAGEWMLDAAINVGTRTLPAYGLESGVVDPVGVDRPVDGSGYRVYRTGSANWATADIAKILPCSRQVANPAGEYTCSTRFCIHLKPLTQEGWPQ